MFRFGHLRKFTRNERGTATIEFVLTMPLFLAALAFAFEFGQIFLAHQATVNNVRGAARYLSRVDMTANNISKAIHMVRTGRLTGGSAPNYLDTTHATVTVTPSYTTFSPPTFSKSGQTLRIVTRVNVPLSIFGFAGPDDLASIPFVVVEDLRFVGS